MKESIHPHVEKELLILTKALLIESGDKSKREIKINAELQRHLGLDSLARAELFRRIEKKWEITLPDNVLAQTQTLADVASFLSSAQSNIGLSDEIKTMVSHGTRPKVDPSYAETLIDVVKLYGEQASTKAHVYFQTEEGHEEIITYGDLLTHSLHVANSLQERGLQQGDTVAIMQPTSPHFFYVFLGTLLAGGIPVPIYPPFRLHMLEAYAKTEAKILTNAQARFLIIFDQVALLSQMLKTFVPTLKQVVTAKELLEHPYPLAKIAEGKSDHPAFIQYTSGSTSDPKGVLLNHFNLLSNIRAYGKAIKVTQDDVAVSWLPLYHDMGLIGMWLGSLYYGVPLVLLTPFTFLNHPERWLWAIHYHRGTISAAPNFAYELCVGKVDEGVIEGLDLSSWRLAANGAEKIYPRTLQQFVDKFSHYGFKREALMPVYGLAESTVGLAVPPLGREFKIDKIDRNIFESEGRAQPTQDKNALELVCCGSALPQHAIRIVNDENQVLAERVVGNLQFQGPSSMQGYFNNPSATEKIYHDGWWDSGDLAYLADNELYVTGRRKDVIIKAGRNLYPVEIEELVGNVEGIRQGCVTAFGVSDNARGTEQLIVVAETKEKQLGKKTKLTAEIKELIASTLDIAPDQIILVAPHTVPKTSSGKLQRAACKQLYLDKKLAKTHLSPAMQLLKLSLKSIGYKLASIISLLLKTVYTLYFAMMYLAISLPTYLFVLISNDHFARKACKYWAKLVLFLGLCPVKTVGKAYLYQSQPLIFASNHASYIDAIVMLSILPLNARFVAKKELFDLPLLGGVLNKLGFIALDRTDLPRGLENTQKINAELHHGNSILIFPEGTFGYAFGLRPFRMGAFKISVETSVPVCPIALKGTRIILRDVEMLMRPGRITVTVCPPIKPEGKEWRDVTQLCNAVRVEIAKYCGEPSLDFIAAQTVAASRKK